MNEVQIQILKEMAEKSLGQAVLAIRIGECWLARQHLKECETRLGQIE